MVRIKFIISLFIILFIFINCISSKDNNDMVSNFFTKGFKLKVGKNLKEIKKNLGKPQEIKKEKKYYDTGEEKLFNGYMYNVIYKGLEIVIYENVQKKQFIFKVILKENLFDLDYNLKIGQTTQKEILNLFGKPNYIDENGKLHYVHYVNGDDRYYLMFY